MLYVFIANPTARCFLAAASKSPHPHAVLCVWALEITYFAVPINKYLPEGPKALEDDWERAGSGAALVLTNQWLL
jgi:hypothetical protein